jgi:transcriptional regulator with XRE-family HTH domain
MKKNLRQARSDAGITQAEIAKKTGVTYQMVYQWEKGFAPVARKHWKALASLLRVSESELEEILVQTLLDSCVSAGDSRALLNAQTSRLYRHDLLLSAISEFEGGSGTYPEKHSPAKEPPADFERERLDFERKILERDRRIFELEKQVEELRREVERARRPAASISSALKITELENEVK